MSLQRFDQTAFSVRLAQAIEEKGDTVARAALRCAMPQATLETYLYRKALPGTKALFQIAQGLNVSADWLLFGGRDVRRVK